MPSVPRLTAVKYSFTTQVSDSSIAAFSRHSLIKNPPIVGSEFAY